MSQGPQMQNVVPLTKGVKALIIINVTVWIGLILILQGVILKNNIIYDLFALVPAKVITDFWIWQLFTYMFMHASGVFHVLFNMLILWWFGAELEMRWGTRFFITYYLFCGVGAGVIYLLGTLAYYLITGQVLSMAAPLVGASGATYGLLLAFGMIFGERVIYFMMLFPMKARYFVMIIGAVELVTMLDSGMGSSVANLAHLGGLIAGFAYLSYVARSRANKKNPAASKRGRRLKLVVNNEKKPDDQNGPKYWN